MALRILSSQLTTSLVACALIASAHAGAQTLPAPVSVEQAAGQALANNLSLIASRYDVPLARAQVVTAGLRPNPTLSLSSDHLDVLGTKFTQVRDVGGGPPENAVRVDVPIERGGKRERRLAVAQAGLRVAELNLQDVIRTLIFDVESAGVDVLAAKAVLDVARQNASSLAKVVDVNSTRVKAGDLAPVDLSRSQVASLQSQNSVLQAEGQLRTARQKLALFVGRPGIPAGVDVEGQMRRDTALPRLDELRANALTLRPDLLSAVQDWHKAQADVRLQNANSKPDFTVGAEVRRPLELDPDGNFLGVFVSTPLQINNRNQGEIARAQTQVLQSEARVHALEAQISTDVDVAYGEASTARALLERIETTMLAQARSVFDSMEYSYRRGEASLLELLDARRALNDTLQAHQAAKADYARALYKIDAIAGRPVDR